MFLAISGCWYLTWTGCQPVFTKKKQTLSKKSRIYSSFKPVTHKIYIITKHKTGIKTCQIHRYDIIPLFRSIFLPCNYTVVHLFLSITSIIFRATTKYFLFLCTLHGYRLFPKEICTEYAAKTLILQIQAFSAKKCLKKLDFVWLF